MKPFDLREVAERAIGACGRAEESSVTRSRSTVRRHGSDAGHEPGSSKIVTNS